MDFQPVDILLIIRSFLDDPLDAYNFTLASPRLFKRSPIETRAKMARKIVKKRQYYRSARLCFKHNFSQLIENPEKWNVCPKCTIPISIKNKKHKIWCELKRQVKRHKEYKILIANLKDIPHGCPLKQCKRCPGYIINLENDICEDCLTHRTCKKCHTIDYIGDCIDDFKEFDDYLCDKCTPRKCNFCWSPQITLTDGHKCNWDAKLKYHQDFLDKITSINRIKGKTDHTIIETKSKSFDWYFGGAIMKEECNIYIILHTPLENIVFPSLEKYLVRNEVSTSITIYHESSVVKFLDIAKFTPNTTGHKDNAAIFWKWDQLDAIVQDAWGVFSPSSRREGTYTQKACHYCHVSLDTSRFCGNCKKTYYCSREHQKIHWKVHKEDCDLFCSKRNNIYRPRSGGSSFPLYSGFYSNSNQPNHQGTSRWLNRRRGNFF